MILDAIGNLYGMTESGGGHAVGTVFKLSHSTAGWTETVLYSFCRTCGGAGTPSGLLHFDTTGNLYGTTQSMITITAHALIHEILPTQKTFGVRQWTKEHCSQASKS